MRVIDFRVWDNAHSNMRCEVTVHSGTRFKFMDAEDDTVWNCHGDVLMQFTGVKDHKRVKIFEGDIVKFNHWVYDEAKRRRMRSFGSIEVDGDCWVINSRRYFGSLWDITSKEVLEVVGNIYEHDVNVLEGDE